MKRSEILAATPFPAPGKYLNAHQSKAISLEADPETMNSGTKLARNVFLRTYIEDHIGDIRKVAFTNGKFVPELAVNVAFSLKYERARFNTDNPLSDDDDFGIWLARGKNLSGHGTIKLKCILIEGGVAQYQVVDHDLSWVWFDEIDMLSTDEIKQTKQTTGRQSKTAGSATQEVLEGVAGDLEEVFGEGGAAFFINVLWNSKGKVPAAPGDSITFPIRSQ